MKISKMIGFAALSMGAVLLASCSGTDTSDTKSKLAAGTETTASGDQFAYAYGLLVGSSLKGQNMGIGDLNVADFAKGMEAGLGAGTPSMDMQAAQELVNARMQEIQQKSSAKNTEAGQKFLSENAKREGVKTTASGLQYEVIKEGKGAKPTLQDKVKVHYHGTLTDGTVFDSSVERGETISFPLNGVITGWQEGLQLMTVGSKYKFYIPSDLGYGPRPAGKIPANSTLIFEVELFGINQ